MRERFLELGAAPERTRTGGNFKYDFEPQAPAPALSQYLEAAHAGKVWIAASTVALISVTVTAAMPLDRRTHGHCLPAPRPGVVHRLRLHPWP